MVILLFSNACKFIQKLFLKTLVQNNFFSHIILKVLTLKYVCLKFRRIYKCSVAVFSLRFL